MLEKSILIVEPTKPYHVFTQIYMLDYPAIVKYNKFYYSETDDVFNHKVGKVDKLSGVRTSRVVGIPRGDPLFFLLDSIRYYVFSVQEEILSAKGTIPDQHLQVLDSLTTSVYDLIYSKLFQ